MVFRSGDPGSESRGRMLDGDTCTEKPPRLSKDAARDGSLAEMLAGMGVRGLRAWVGSALRERQGKEQRY